MRISSFKNKRLQDWLLVALAVVLFASPWVIGFASAPADWCAWLSGVLIAYVAFASLAEVQQWEEWVTAGFGIWLLLAPKLLGFMAISAATHCFWIIGALTILVSMWAEWNFRHPAHPAT